MVVYSHQPWCSPKGSCGCSFLCVFQEPVNQKSCMNLTSMVACCVYAVVTLYFSFTVANRRMDKQILVNLYDGMLLSNDKECTANYIVTQITCKHIIWGEKRQTQKAISCLTSLILHCGKPSKDLKSVSVVSGGQGLITERVEMIDFKEEWGDFLWW